MNFLRNLNMKSNFKFNEEHILDAIRKLNKDHHELVEKYVDSIKLICELKKSQTQLTEENKELKKQLQFSFYIGEDKILAIHNWLTNHDKATHDNPEHYHGAAGGGYEYVFYPTNIGTFGECICTACKYKAISEHGKDWHKHLETNDGLFVFQEVE